MIKGIIFDLDGVLTDTAKLHYLAWKRMAREMLGFAFSEKDNDAFRGVSRAECMKIMQDLAGVTLDADTREACQELKNRYYVESLGGLNSGDLYEGAFRVLDECKTHGLKTAVASASKNARLVLEKTGLAPCFEIVVDGNMVKRTKPDPECFLLAAKMMGYRPGECIVVEDAQAGLDGAHNAGFICVGIGTGALQNADLRFERIQDMRVAEVLKSVSLENF